MMGWHGWGMGFGWIIGLALLILIIWIVVRLVIQNQYPRHENRKAALDILRERYARGEIDKKEFEEKKKDLI